MLRPSKAPVGLSLLPVGCKLILLSSCLLSLSAALPVSLLSMPELLIQVSFVNINSRSFSSFAYNAANVPLVLRLSVGILQLGLTEHTFWLRNVPLVLYWRRLYVRSLHAKKQLLPQKPCTVSSRDLFNPSTIFETLHLRSFALGLISKPFRYFIDNISALAFYPPPSHPAARRCHAAGTSRRPPLW